ncbi:MAG: hypothetical protein J7M09_01515 [Deltaproteobacteria bacterium]|nr:hypothetical protein [Candidatus Tharpella sp.]
MNTSDNDCSTQPILTETMARLLLNQRHWREAIDIYRKLGQQNPGKIHLYEKEISQIKEYFKPQPSSEMARKTIRTNCQIARLKKFLKIMEKQQATICKQENS